MIIEENRRDFRQKYRTCTVLADIKESQQLFYIDDIDEERQYIYGSTITENDDWLARKLHVEDVEIDFKFPELGLLNAKKGVSRLSRFSSQQYRQSFNDI